MTAALEPDTPLAVKVVPSPNHGERKDGKRPGMILLHYTGMQSGVEALQRLTNPLAEVSAHYLVWEDGRIFQLVPEAARAWHAGQSVWAGETDINSVSIGIEIVNPGHEHGYVHYTEDQIRSVMALSRDILLRWGIGSGQILAHSDVSCGRKRDPGELFPWDRLAQEGLGLWVEPAPITGGRSFQRGDEGQPIQALQAMLAMFGYGIGITGVFDQRMFDVVEAFQRHFRPALVDGVADASTITTLRNLLLVQRDKQGR
jgi:N-acetylmuramoyl-L-alanine amidase